MVEDEEMVGGGEEEEEDDDGGGGDPAVAMTVRMDRRAARRARRASAPAVTTSTPMSTFRAMPSQWSVEEVTAFIHALPGKAALTCWFLPDSLLGHFHFLWTWQRN